MLSRDLSSQVSPLCPEEESQMAKIRSPLTPRGAMSGCQPGRGGGPPHCGRATTTRTHTHGLSQGRSRVYHRGWCGAGVSVAANVCTCRTMHSAYRESWTQQCDGGEGQCRSDTLPETPFRYICKESDKRKMPMTVYTYTSLSI